GDGQHINVFRIRFQFTRDVVRQIDHVVLIIAAAAEQELFASLQHADDAKFLGADFDRVANWGLKAKEIIGYFRPNDANTIVLIVFKLRKKAAFGDDLRTGLLKIRQRALQAD